MRSLYVDDIPGARPVKRVYDKSKYIRLLNEEIYRFARNPQEKRVIDWYSPSKKPTEPLDRNDDNLFITKRTLKKSFELGNSDLSKSMALPRAASMEQSNIMQNNSDMRKSSVLSGTAKNSLNLSSISNKGDNPYFPHRYIVPDLGESNRWSGSRNWSQQPTHVVHMPSTKNQYFRKWN